ncbi:ribonuclease T2-like [Podila epicladia]|nr:ribonuclease T2-like [Podila epicladia]
MGNNNCFWSHEWNKHGTCISNLDPSCTSNPVKGKDKYSYFSKGLELRAKFDLFKALAAKMIFPSQSKRFWTEDVRDAIKAEFDVDPGLYCKNGTLHEVWLYFKVKNRDHPVSSSPLSLFGPLCNSGCPSSPADPWDAAFDIGCKNAALSVCGHSTHYVSVVKAQFDDITCVSFDVSCVCTPIGASPRGITDAALQNTLTLTGGVYSDLDFGLPAPKTTATSATTTTDGAIPSSTVVGSLPLLPLLEPQCRTLPRTALFRPRQTLSQWLPLLLVSPWLSCNP